MKKLLGSKRPRGNEGRARVAQARQDPLHERVRPVAVDRFGAEHDRPHHQHVGIRKIFKNIIY